ncbi:hypothetical protein CDD83_4587 [Cordyceps sp. RAO-2017]|nr:hypothetical protein CDD83_4587 [Cordyceps sp. RAO-2017]
MTRLLWKAQRSRQDFSEELFLRADLPSVSGPELPLLKPGIYTAKITLDTTAGHFELPNYMNGQVAGPLLDDDPGKFCLQDCINQFHDTNDREPDNSIHDPGPNPVLPLNKGPLLTVTLALFGTGSFLDSVSTEMANHSYPDSNRAIRQNCQQILPLAALLRSPLVDRMESSWTASCARVHRGAAGTRLDEIRYIWSMFHNENEKLIPNAFTAAAFLANDAWMMQPVHTTLDQSAFVAFDLGTDTQVPVMSLAGMVVVSLLLALDLACLLGLALYSAWTPRWTILLDSFAMMRIGASIADRMPLLTAPEADRIAILDETPGWIGDAGCADADAAHAIESGEQADEKAGEDGRVRELGLGAEMPLRGERRYRCYRTAERTHARKRDRLWQQVSHW